MGRSWLLLAAALIMMQRGLPGIFLMDPQQALCLSALQIVEEPAKKQQQQQQQI